MASSTASVFHGNPSLANTAPQLASFKESWARDMKAVLKIIMAGGKTETIAAVATSLPDNDPLRYLLTQMMVRTLWDSMLHPPLSYKGPKMQYRAADGSGNNYLFPQLGQAGLPYAKTVQPLGATTGQKPDPGDIFDMLMARDESQGTINKDSDLGISSQLLYHADLIIHDIFRTNTSDRNISDTSSYLDLSPLYGRDREHQEAVRTMWKDGKLKPDSWAEDRLKNQPPGVQIYIIMYNRFHNYVAEQLEAINENGKFSRLPFDNKWMLPDEFAQKVLSKEVLDEARQHHLPLKTAKDLNAIKNVLPASNNKSSSTDYRSLLSDDYIAKLESEPKLNVENVTQEDRLLYGMWELYQTIRIDEELFQTARLVTCGLYITISINDYLRCLMRKHAEPTSWTLDPRKELSLFGKKETMQRGIGNQVTTEFNALYRFHSPISKRDASWTKWFLQQLMLLKGLYLEKDPEAKNGGMVTKAQYEQGDIPLNILKVLLVELASEGNKKRGGFPATPYPPPAQKYKYQEGEKDPRLEDLEEFKKVFWVLEDDTFDKNGNRVLKPKPLERDPISHKFKDEELLAEMARVMQDPICEFGAQNVPRFMRSIEILGILQARKWEMASLNEFRVFFGMPKHKTFADMNSDVGIQNRLESLYGHPDMVEFYPGVFVEGQGRNLDPGSSCGNGSATALWRAVFSDAVTLVRSDRFYTTDWNNDSLTSWGLAEVSSDPNIFKGGVFARLYQRAFPGYLSPDSIHMWQPLYTPAMNAILAHDQGFLGELQSIEEIGVSAAYFKQVMRFRNDASLLTTDLRKFLAANRFTDISEADIQELIHVQQQINAQHDKLGLFTRVFKNRSADAEQLSRKLCFKLLYRKTKLRIEKQQPPYIRISTYKTLSDEFLNPSKIAKYKNPGYADAKHIPSGPLRDVLAQQTSLYADAARIFREAVSKNMEKQFLAYFFNMSDTIRKRQELDFTYYNNGNTTCVKQLDIVHDYAIPIVTRFAADLLGVGDQVRTELALKRPWGEHELHEHFQNCQDYLTFDSDETRAFRRRKAFQKSIAVLQKLAQDGVRKAQLGWLEFGNRNYSDRAEKDPATRESVAQVRAFGARLARSFTKELGDQEKAAAVMLAGALDAIHKSVVMFVEVLELLISPVSVTKGEKPKRIYWEALQKLVKKGDATTDGLIQRYVLEAQRIKVQTPLIRQYCQKSDPDFETKGRPKIQLDSGEKYTLKDGDMFLLDVQKAQNTPDPWKNPEQILLDRAGDNEPKYLLYNPTPESAFNTKQLTIYAVTGMIKRLATLCRLRMAHEELGRLKRVLVPKRDDDNANLFRLRYLTEKWDQTSNTPSTWSLRYDGVGFEVADGVDNSIQHHIIELLPGQTGDKS